MDPLERRVYFGFNEKILDWPLFWTKRENRLKHFPPAPDSIFPLAANNASMKNEAAETQDGSGGGTPKEYKRDLSSAVEDIMYRDVVEYLRDIDNLLAAPELSDRTE